MDKNFLDKLMKNQEKEEIQVRQQLGMFYEDDERAELTTSSKQDPFIAIFSRLRKDITPQAFTEEQMLEKCLQIRDNVKQSKPDNIELPALFNRAFAAYKSLIDTGYVWAGSDRFKPEISIENSSISVDKERGLKRVVAACCEFDADAVVSTEELTYAYGKYCHQENHLPIAGPFFKRIIGNTS